MDSLSQRLDKFLANRGITSRRNSKSFLKDNTVTVNGNRVRESGTRVTPNHDEIKINGQKVKKPPFVYYVLNKPKGYISTTADEYNRKNVLTLIKTKERIYPIGRLDKDTTGLLLLSNDGELTNLLTHPRYHIPKTYRLKVKGFVSKEQLHSLRHGVLLRDGITSPAKVTVIHPSPKISTIEIILHEGRNRQIRRMCEEVGIELLSLTRVQLGPIQLADLKEGTYRILTPKEVLELRQLAQQRL